MKQFLWFICICLSAQNALAFNVTLDLQNVAGNKQKPIIKIKTNLPPKTILMGSVANPINQGGTGYFGQAESTVSTNQIAEFGPFSKNGESLSVGIYHVTITMVMAALQPKEVQVLIGSRGEQLTGNRISLLPEKGERYAFHKFSFKINADNLIYIIPPDQDTHTIGSADETWKKVQSEGREIYIQTNCFYYNRKHRPGTGFSTYVLTNLPESYIVGAPQSVMNKIDGNCETRRFSVIGSLFFTGKNKSGSPIHDLPPENFERKLVPGSPFEKAFDMLCETAKNK